MPILIIINKPPRKPSLTGWPFHEVAAIVWQPTISSISNSGCMSWSSVSSCDESAFPSHKAMADKSSRLPRQRLRINPVCCVTEIPPETNRKMAHTVTSGTRVVTFYKQAHFYTRDIHTYIHTYIHSKPMLNSCTKHKYNISGDKTWARNNVHKLRKPSMELTC